jgi:aryl-alcohol dehydrogenase-like predicted oxidoreductase
MICYTEMGETKQTVTTGWVCLPGKMFCEMTEERTQSFMQYKRIPHTHLSPSTICLGTALFGTDVDDVTSFGILDTFFEHGGTFLDTAHAYGEWVPNGIGQSERVIGRWLKERGVREQVVLATKGGQPYEATPHLSRLNHDELVSDLDHSLQCLQVDTIDLYWLHRDDPTLPVAAILETLNQQVARGKIRYFGCSNWRTNRIREALQYAAHHAIAGFVGNQLMWSFATPNPHGIEDTSLVFMDTQMLEFHRETNLAVLAYTPQARGFFSKLSTDATTLSERLRKTYDTTENRKRLQRLQSVSDELSLSIPTLLLAYLTNQPFPTFPISGNTSMQQLLENIQAGDVVLRADTMRYLEQGG